MIFYGLFMPHLHHINLIFQDNDFFKYSAALLVFLFGLLMVGFHLNDIDSETEHNEKAQPHNQPDC